MNGMRRGGYLDVVEGDLLAGVVEEGLEGDGVVREVAEVGEVEEAEIVVDVGKVEGEGEVEYIGLHGGSNTAYYLYLSLKSVLFNILEQTYRRSMRNPNDVHQLTGGTVANCHDLPL